MGTFSKKKTKWPDLPPKNINIWKKVEKKKGTPLKVYENFTLYHCRHLENDCWYDIYFTEQREVKKELQDTNCVSKKRRDQIGHDFVWARDPRFKQFTSGNTDGKFYIFYYGPVPPLKNRPPVQKPTEWTHDIITE